MYQNIIIFTEYILSKDTYRKYIITSIFFWISAEDHDVGLGICGWLLTAISWLLVIVTLPFSLCVCFKVSTSSFNTSHLKIIYIIHDYLYIKHGILCIHRSFKNTKGRLYFGLVDFYREAQRVQVWIKKYFVWSIHETNKDNV